MQASPLGTNCTTGMIQVSQGLVNKTFATVQHLNMVNSGSSGSGVTVCYTLIEYYAEAWEINKKGCKGRKQIAKDEK